MASLFNSNRHLLSQISKHFSENQSLILNRAYATHWDPKFKKLRKLKVTKPKSVVEDILDQKQEKVKRGVEPPYTFSYKPLNITSSREIFDAYVPPEGDGKASLFSKEYAKGTLTKATASMKKYRHAKLIKKYESTFEDSLFGDIAQQIYIDAHNALMNRDLDNLQSFVTENALAKMYDNMKYKTIKWQWLESLEAPQVTHITTREMVSKNDLFAQITVRIHSKQILAVYDRFGRLAFGSNTLPKNVLEYAVFERHLTSPYGVWRLHDKIIPEWMPPQTPVIRSYVMPKLYKLNEEAEKKIESKFKKDDSHLPAEETSGAEAPKLT